MRKRRWLLVGGGWLMYGLLRAESVADGVPWL